MIATILKFLWCTGILLETLFLIRYYYVTPKEERNADNIWGGNCFETTIIGFLVITGLFGWITLRYVIKPEEKE